MRWLAYGLLALAVLLMASAPFLWIAGAWVRGDVGESLLVTGIITAGTGFVLALGWCEIDVPVTPRPRLTRAQRKQLRAEESRIALEQAIRDAERRAGL